MLKLEWNLKFFTKSIIYIVQGNYFVVMMKFVRQSANPQTFQRDISLISTFYLQKIFFWRLGKHLHA